MASAQRMIAALAMTKFAVLLTVGRNVNGRQAMLATAKEFRTRHAS